LQKNDRIALLDKATQLLLEGGAGTAGIAAVCSVIVNNMNKLMGLSIVFFTLFGQTTQSDLA
jgi:hypothetical protein